MNNGYIKQLALRAGFVLGKLTVDNLMPHSYSAVVAIGNDPANHDVVERKFVASMERVILESSGVATKIALHNVNHLDNSLVEFHFTFLTDEGEEAEQHTDEVPFVLPTLGSVVQSPNGFTGQIIAYSKDEPRLIKVRWHKFSGYSKGSNETSETWENPSNQKVITEPIKNQWWPKKGEPIDKSVRPVGIGVPISTLVSEEMEELTSDDLALRTITDKEAEKSAPKVVPLTYRSGLNRCACGCNLTCKSSFAAGHDMRAKSKLMRKMAGQEPMWTPNADLIHYIKTHPAWWDQFGVLVQELEAKGAVASND